MEKKKLALNTKLDFKGLDFKSFSSKGKKNKKPETVSEAEYTTRTSINLARKERDEGAKKKIIIIGVVALVVVVLVAKFGVIDQYAKLHEAQAEYDAVHQENVEMQETVSRYDEVQKEYRNYSMEWMLEDSDTFVSVDRQELLDMVETVMMPRGNVLSLSVSGDQMNVKMSGMSLQEISKMFDELLKDPNVVKVSLSKAATEEDVSKTLVNFDVVITLFSIEPEETETETDTTTSEEAAE